MKKLLGVFFILALYGCSDTKEVESDPEIKAKYEQKIKEKIDANPKINIPSSMDVVDIAVCTAAAMKAGQGIELFRPWADTLTARYKKIYPNKSPEELDSYVTERMSDKRKYLESTGISTSAGFYKFYKQNCEF